MNPEAEFSLSQLFRDLTALGSFLFYSLILLLALAFQEFDLFLKLLAGLLFIMLLSILIRLVYFKNRPKKQSFSNLIERIDASSFPSIHSARILFLFLVSLALPLNHLTKLLFLITTLAVIYSRIYLKKHYWTDVLGGIILSLLAFWLTSFF